MSCPVFEDNHGLDLCGRRLNIFTNMIIGIIPFSTFHIIFHYTVWLAIILSI